MKPIKLKIKGFNSFLEEQVIDFEKLIDNGIFGIFGPTGSGKSSVIDAMTFALYGNVARYDVNERRAFININADSASILFEFSLMLDELTFFEVAREIKIRKSGNFVHNARLIRKIGGISEVIGESAKEVSEQIIKIIGLDYKDFIRSVVLPQGKFSEFLMLKNTERRNMLERIFGLEEYGTILNIKINERRKNQFKTVADINSKLEIFGDISEETILSLEEDLKNKQLIFERSKNNLAEKRALFERYKNYIDLKKEFDIYTLKETELKSKKEDIDKKIEKVDRGKRAEKIYHFLTDYKRNEEEYDKAYVNFENYKNELEMAEKAFIDAKKVVELFNEDKIKQYPQVIKKEAELIQGKKIKKDIEEVEKERKALKDNYKKNKHILLEKNSELKNEIKTKRAIDDEILDIQKEKENFTVSPEYRKDIEYASNIEKKSLELNEKCLLEEKNKNFVLESIEKENLELIVLEKEKSDIEKLLEDLKKNNEDLLREFSYDFSDIIELQEKNEENRRNFLLKKERYVKYRSLQAELESIEKNKKDCEKKLESILKQETEKNKEISEIDDKIKLLENKEFILELALSLRENTPCPVCGSLNHPLPAEKLSDDALEEFRKRKIVLEKDSTEISDEKNELKSKNSVFNSELIKINNEILKLKIDFNIDEEERKFEKENNEFKKIKDDFEKFQKNKKIFEEKEKKQGEQFNILNIKISKLKSEIKKDRENLEKIEINMNETLIQKDKNMCELNQLREKFSVEDFQQKYSELIDFEKTKNQLESKEKENRRISENKQKNIEKLKSEIVEYEKIIESITTSGIEKKIFIEKNSKLLEEICDGRNFEDYLAEINEKKCYFEKNEIELKENLNLLESKKNLVLENKIKYEKEKDTFEKIKKKSVKELENAVAENGFLSVQDVEKAYMPKEIIDFEQKEIDSYNDMMKDILSNLRNISAKIKKDDISCNESDIEKISSEINILNEAVEKILSEIGHIKSKISETTENFAKVKELKKELKIQTHKLDLISDLSDTIKGNRFVEFIAKKQLYYVTWDASVRLGKMTKGRYAIELDEENSNFIIRDDFNGGARRNPNSLSGGEVFLVSLCLALALSGKIQLKNNAPLETFFLDEGFGTLDSSVLDIVMDCLEQLSCEKINVGVITHVEEIKNRIQSKIVILPDNGIDGSKITIE